MITAQHSRLSRIREWFRESVPLAVRITFLVCASVIALGAALAPLVYLLRRMGVG